MEMMRWYLIVYQLFVWASMGDLSLALTSPSNVTNFV
jgi:hypothetical protein